MNILALYPYIPYPTDRGAYYRGFHLLKALGAEHNVDFVGLAEKNAGTAYQSVFAEFCRSVEFIPFEHPEWDRLFPKRIFNPLPSTVAHWTLPHVGARIGQLMQRNEYDAVHIFDAVLAQFFLKQHQNVPLVVDRTRVDLQYQLMERKRMKFGLRQRILNWENLAKLFYFERAVSRRSSFQIVCGPDDEAFVHKFISPDLNVSVIPNGVDLDYFDPASAPAEQRATSPTILFCGAMDYNPNIDALRWYFSEIHDPLCAKVKGLSVLVVGKDPVAEVRAYASKVGVTVTGGVPDVRPYYRRAWLQIVPLRIGGGTRLKIVESLAMGTPVVSSTIGAQGLGLRHNHDVLFADETSSFVRETERALHDKSLRLHLERAGADTVRRRLSWPSLGQQLLQSYSDNFRSHALPQRANVPA
jgi:polysaccharide biosynthesis protein PslH